MALTLKRPGKQPATPPETEDEPKRPLSDVYEIDLMTPEELAEQEKYISTLPPGSGIHPAVITEFDLPDESNLDLDSLLPQEEDED